MYTRFFLSLLLLYHFSIQSYELSIVAIFQNEGRFLKEWIDYHRKVGVEHFWLYNNNSTDNYAEILSPYIQDGVVNLIEWPSIQEEKDWNHHCFDVQTSAYSDALSKAKKVSKWLALIDLDEYIVPVCENTVLDVLEKHYKDASGVCINWQCYGTSNIWMVPEGQMLQNLTWKMKWNHPRNFFYKSIVKPKETMSCINPHYCLYDLNHWHINTNYDVIEMQNTGVYIDKIRINHYWTRDEFNLQNIKIPRYEKWGGIKETILQYASEMNEEYDDYIIKFQ